MVKKILIALVVVLVVAVAGLAVWARSILATDTVRTAIAAQISKSIGQPVAIGNISASIYPRVTVTLGDVTIGKPAKVTVTSLHVGTDFGALLSRRIEHANLKLAGARIELPLPEFTIASSAAPSEPSGSSVEIVSVDEVVLEGVDIVSGGRTLHGDVEVVPQGAGLEVRRVSLKADNTAIDITGRITDLAGPTGELTVKAGALNVDNLLAFLNDFSAGAGMATSSPSASTPAAAANTMNLVVSVNADKATMGTLTIDTLAGKAHVGPELVRLDPISFGVFGGKYEGALALSLGAVPTFDLEASLSGVDMAAATAFAGSPNTITGRLAGRLDLAGKGLDAAGVLKTARGTARVDITDGTVKNLGLVQSVVVATSGKSGGASSGSKDEPFTRLGGTLAIAGGSASTQDLVFVSKNLALAAAGGLKLDGTAINLAGKVQLSEELSKQAGSDLVRYTQENGKVTLPATITGSAEQPQIRIDVANMAKRAVTNVAKEEANKAISKGLGGLLKKP